MIKRTLYFGNPPYLKTKNKQLVFEAVRYGNKRFCCGSFKVVNNPYANFYYKIIDGSAFYN